MEGSSSGSSKPDHTTIIVVVVVVAVFLTISIVSAVYLLSVSNVFGSVNTYSTDANVTATAEQTSLFVTGGNCNINIDPGNDSLIHVNLTVTASNSLNSNNVYISVNKLPTEVRITLHTPILSTYASNAILHVPTSMNFTYLNLSTMNGNENINYPFTVENLNLTTFNGNIGITSYTDTSHGMLGGNIRASTSNGNININGSGFSGVLATTINGNIHITTVPGAITTGNFTLRTINGNLNLYLDNQSKASIELSTTNGGITTSGLSIQATTTTVHNLTGILNGGGANVTMKTTNGNIYLYGG